MGLKFTHVRGAETYDDNYNGSNYVAAWQFTTGRSELHKLTISPLSGMAADVYAWIFDTASGSSSSTQPTAVRLIPAGLADSWDMGNGGLRFNNGIYVSCCVGAPVDDSSTPTAIGASGLNKVIVRADYRVGA